jgi:hypothetical protein
MIGKAIRFAIVLLAGTTMFGQSPKQNDASAASIVGYLRDAGCVHRFHEVMKPLPNGCLEACVRAGSPLVILTQKEEVYHPISSEMPDIDIRQKLMPYAGKLVKISGHVYERGGSKAITVEHIEEVKD